MSWVIAVDGPKGAGKSTALEGCRKNIPGVVELSLDGVRRGLGIEGTSFEKNIVAFAEVEKLIEQALVAHKNVILDCGLYNARIESLKSLSHRHKADLHLVFLSAPYEELVRRVTERDAQKGRIFDKQRFDEVYKVVMDKDFSAFTVIDTSLVGPGNVVDQLCNLIKE